MCVRACVFYKVTDLICLTETIIFRESSIKKINIILCTLKTEKKEREMNEPREKL